MEYQSMRARVLAPIDSVVDAVADDGLVDSRNIIHVRPGQDFRSSEPDKYFVRSEVLMADNQAVEIGQRGQALAVGEVLVSVEGDRSRGDGTMLEILRRVCDAYDGIDSVHIYRQSDYPDASSPPIDSDFADEAPGASPMGNVRYNPSLVVRERGEGIGDYRVYASVPFKYAYVPR